MVREYSTLKLNWESDRTGNTISYRIVHVLYRDVKKIRAKERFGISFTRHFHQHL